MMRTAKRQKVTSLSHIAESLTQYERASMTTDILVYYHGYYITKLTVATKRAEMAELLARKCILDQYRSVIPSATDGDVWPAKIALVPLAVKQSGLQLHYSALSTFRGQVPQYLAPVYFLTRIRAEAFSSTNANKLLETLPDHAFALHVHGSRMRAALTTALEPFGCRVIYCDDDLLIFLQSNL